tara:strand:- start:3023 stop:3940 length:918 start_codon:yes stop_codon:yes gene_type:complete
MGAEELGSGSSYTGSGESTETSDTADTDAVETDNAFDFDEGDGITPVEIAYAKIYYWVIRDDYNTVDDYGIIEGDLVWATYQYMQTIYEAEVSPLAGIDLVDESGDVVSSGTSYTVTETNTPIEGSEVSEKIMDEIVDGDMYGITPGFLQYTWFGDYAVDTEVGLFSTANWMQFPPGRSKPDPLYTTTQVEEEYTTTVTYSPDSTEAVELQRKFSLEIEGVEGDHATPEEAFGAWLTLTYDEVKSLTVQKIGNLAKPLYNFQKTKNKPLPARKLSLFASEDVTQTDLSIATGVTTTTTTTEEESY